MCLSLFFLLVLIAFTNGNPISPDSKKIYSDISAGRGLYWNFDKVTNLNASNFRQTIFNNSNGNAWLIEFYNSWCGHCHRFSPVWKQFAVDIYEWRHSLRVGAVDCSNPFNTPLCRDFEVMYYPLLKYFPPLPANNYLGFPIKVGSVEHLLNSSLRMLRQDAGEGLLDRPELLPYLGSSPDIWAGLPRELLYMVVVLQKSEDILGEILAMDFLKVPNCKVKIVFDNNTDVVPSFTPTRFPSVFLVDRNNVITPVLSPDDSRFTVYSAVRTLLAGKGVAIPELVRETVPSDVVVDVSQVMAIMEIEEKIKKKLNLNSLSDVVFQVDLEGAIRQSLKVEIPRHKNIAGEALEALNNYLKTLIDFFPFGKNGISYLTYIHNGTKDKSSIGGFEFLNLVKKSEELYKPFLSRSGEWLGCRGSRPEYRGYPCSLWSLFHCLTVHQEQAAREGGGDNSKRVLRSMTGYIRHFFGCTDCAEHFAQMAVTFEGNVTTPGEAVLWLWAAHNTVNKRLEADSTEDPAHPKVLFPPKTLCQACQYNNGTWNLPVVLSFLRNMYLDISYLVLDDLPKPTTQPTPLPAKILKHQQIIDEKFYNYSQADSKPILSHFNIFDVSLFVMLYLFSMTIIVLVCIKFLFKKTYRKKAYLYDIFQKV